MMGVPTLPIQSPDFSVLRRREDEEQEDGLDRLEDKEPGDERVLTTRQHEPLMAYLATALSGMLIGEPWDVDELAEAGAADQGWSFLLTVAPLTLVGAVGSPANAIALR